MLGWSPVALIDPVRSVDPSDVIVLAPVEVSSEADRDDVSSEVSEFEGVVDRNKVSPDDENERGIRVSLRSESESEIDSVTDTDVERKARDDEAENDRVRREGVLEDPVASKLGEPVCVADSDRVAPLTVAVRVAAVCVSETLALSAVMETDVALIVTVKRVGAALGVADCECSTDAEGESESEAVPVRDGPD